MRPRKIQCVLSDDRQYVVIGIVCAVVVCTLILQARLDGAILAVLIVSVRAVCPSVFVDLVLFLIIHASLATYWGRHWCCLCVLCLSCYCGAVGQVSVESIC